MKFYALIILSLFFLAPSLVAKSTEMFLGEKAYSQGALDTARKHFEAAIENGEPSGDPHLYIGLILESRRQYAESIPYFRAAAARRMSKKFKKVAYWKMVILCRQAKMYSESLRYVDLLQEMGEKSELFDKIRLEAENSSTPPIDKNIQGADSVEKALNLEKKLHELQAKDEEESTLKPLRREIIQTFKNAISLDAHWNSFRWHIARHYEKLQEHDAAITTYKLIWKDSGDARAAYKLGMAERRKGKYKDALRYFAAVLEKNTNDTTLNFYTRLNAAQSHYGLSNYNDALTHAKKAKALADEIELKDSTRASLRRVYCLAAISTAKDDTEYCRFSKKSESAVFINLVAMKRAIQKKEMKNATKFASRIYETDTSDEDESEATIPAYAFSDLPVAISVLFQAEEYHRVLELTDKFTKKLDTNRDFTAWRAVSHFALKEFALASLEFNKMQNLTPAQMNLHLMSLAHAGNWAEVKIKGSAYLKNPNAREKLERNFRTLKLYAPLREEKDFEAWMQGKESPTLPQNKK